MPIHAVARKYDSTRGFVQTLAQTCEGFASGTIQFCDRMGWGMLKSVLDHMCDRLKAGARADLLDLAKIPFVKSRTARVLWDNGFKSLMAVAEADPKDLVPVLLQAQPGKTRIFGDDEEKFRQKVMMKAEIIVSSANRLWGAYLSTISGYGCLADRLQAYSSRLRSKPISEGNGMSETRGSTFVG